MIGRTNTGGGGGGGLNFKVVGGAAAPSNPKENTIWINTETDITGWEFSATEPTCTDGMVWITIGTASTVAFNALKKNGITVYPLTAKQYVSGAWVDKTAMIYQNGAWAELWNGVLYDYGNQYKYITGGWVGSQTVSSNTTSGGKLTVNEDNLSFTNVNGGSFGVVTANAMDLTRFSTLHTITSGSARVRVAPEFPTAESNMVIIGGNISGTNTESAIDISAVTGAYKIAIGNRAAEGTVKVYRVWLT